ncbi:MAG: hypothetical protein AAFY28_10760, partial [Actinomycetota bacterium]
MLERSGNSCADFVGAAGMPIRTATRSEPMRIALRWHTALMSTNRHSGGTDEVGAAVPGSLEHVPV